MYRCMRKENGKWVKESPPNISAWMWANDGAEAVVIDDRTATYYVGLPVMMDNYREAWAKEKLRNDPRKTAMFSALDRNLFTETGGSNP